jgi:pimeloyl-ACP methyl ester carboxylesterase
MLEELHDPRPHSRLTIPVRRDVLVDRAMYRLVASRAGQPDPELVARVGDEVTTAVALFDEQGWLAHPETYHRTPPAPDGVRTRKGRWGDLRYTTLTWADQYEPRAEEPGAERFAGYSRNRIAHAALLEHRWANRPWIVCLHGFGMGTTNLDLRLFRAYHLHEELGINLAFLTLPLHGRRRNGRSALPQFPGVEILDNVHGLEQATWDARQLLQYLRARTDQPVAVMGLSLGGGVAATVASLDDPHAALLLIPAVDIGALMTEAVGKLATSVPEDLVAASALLMRVVSPLELTPRVPVDRRFIVAATLDRFVPPTSQAVALWRHWDQPEMHWYHGGHVSLFWAGGVQDAIDAKLHAVGLL